jgi:serine/threonine protein kinase
MPELHGGESRLQISSLAQASCRTLTDPYALCSQPERIKGESQGQASSYTASSDVWSLGLSIIEFAIGHYPYPPETYQNVFAQLTAIVHGDPPALPDRYGDVAQSFVTGCLEKSATRRPTYKQLMVRFLFPLRGEEGDGGES